MNSLATNHCSKKDSLVNILDDFSVLPEKDSQLLFEALTDTNIVKSFSDFTNGRTDGEFKPFLFTNTKHSSDSRNTIHSQIIELTEKFEKQKSELEEKHQHSLELVSANIRGEEAKHLLEFVEKAIIDLRTSISQQVGEALVVFLGSLFKKQAVEKFAQKLKLSLLCNTSPLVIEGNKELLDLLKSYIGQEASKFRFKETDSLELSFKYLDKVLATNIESLLAELDGNKL